MKFCFILACDISDPDEEAASFMTFPRTMVLLLLISRKRDWEAGREEASTDTGKQAVKEASADPGQTAGGDQKKIKRCFMIRIKVAGYLTFLLLFQENSRDP